MLSAALEEDPPSCFSGLLDLGCVTHGVWELYRTESCLVSRE